MSYTFGTNKATDRKNIREMLVALTLTGLFASMAGIDEKPSADVKSGVDKLGWNGFADLAIDVLRTQTSGSRGRPALEEQPIHAIIKGLRASMVSFTANESVEKAQKVLAKSVKEAEKAQKTLLNRRALFKPSKRIQGSKRLPVLPTATEE